MKNKKHEIIDHSDMMECWVCDGDGYIVKFYDDKPYHRNKLKCKLCSGTGKFRESHYYIIDNKNKIAIDSDTIG